MEISLALAEPKKNDEKKNMLFTIITMQNY